MADRYRDWESERERDRSGQHYRGEGERYRDSGERARGGERGMVERGADEVRSWFGDEDAERRRRMDEREGGGYGARESWRDRPRDRDGYGRERPSSQASDYSRDEYGWSAQSTGGHNDRERGDFGEEQRRGGRWGSANRRHAARPAKATAAIQAASETSRPVRTAGPIPKCG